MHTIVKRTRSDKTDAFQVRIRTKGREPINETFDTLAQAETFVAGLEAKFKKTRTKLAAGVASIRDQVIGEAEFQNESLRDVLEGFNKSVMCTDRHRNSLPTVIRNVGDVKISGARAFWVKNYVAKMLKTKTRRGTFFCYDTLKVHLSVMFAACSHRAEELNLDEQKFFFSSKFFPKGWSNKRKRRLKPGEHQSIMAGMRAKRGASKYHWRLLYRLAIETGARLQELLLSEWSELECDGQVWTIPAEHTKAGEARSVSLSTTARRIVRLLRVLSKSQSKRIFHTLHKPDSVSAMFHKFIEKVGIEGLRFHDLRHEAISRMVVHKKNAGTSAIMFMVGHKSHEMTARYTNLRPSELIGLLD
jgi:integrase